MTTPHPRAAHAAVRYPRAFGGDDAALLHGLRHGDHEAQTELFRRHAPLVERLLVRVLGWDAELEDLVQEVFLRALRGLPSLRGDHESLRPWLRRVTVYTARETLRRRRVRRMLGTPANGELPEQAADAIDPARLQALRSTRRLLERLPATEGIPLTLRFIDGMELTEVAAACDVSLATTKRRLRKARTRFQKLAGRDPVLREYLPQP